MIAFHQGVNLINSVKAYFIHVHSCVVTFMHCSPVLRLKCHCISEMYAQIILCEHLSKSDDMELPHPVADEESSRMKTGKYSGSKWRCSRSTTKVVKDLVTLTLNLHSLALHVSLILHYTICRLIKLTIILRLHCHVNSTLCLLFLPQFRTLCATLHVCC